MDKNTKESGLQRYTGIKKYGKKGFEELQKAGREGASEEEKGAIKDKYLKKKTNEGEDLQPYRLYKGTACKEGYKFDPKTKMCVPIANTKGKGKMGKRVRPIGEGLGELADVAERDHEVQMARADLYKIAKYAIKLHDMLKTVSEAEGIEGWQQSKITKAADYMGSVFHSLDYDMKFAESRSTKNVMKRSVAESEQSYLESMQNKISTKLAEAKGVCPDCGNPSWTTLPEEKQKGVDGKVCWKGYKRMGTKKKGGKTVDNCVKM
jgi:hypothetical protein